MSVGTQDSSIPAPTAVPSNEAHAWFKAEVQPHDAHLRYFLHTTFPRVRDLDDIVQDSYVKIWKARAERRIQSVRSYLFQIANNIALDKVRRQQRSPIAGITGSNAFEVLDDRPSAREVASAHEEEAILAEAIHSLPARCREIVVMRKLKSLSQKEIAARLGISEETVANQVYKGVKRCEEFLRKRGLGMTATAEEFHAK